jgi:ParB family chromosome partitioning protein
MIYQKKTGLGRGLRALLDDSDLPENDRQQVSNESSSLGSISSVKISQVQVNPFQPRTDFDPEALHELAESIKLQGLIQPITVRQSGQNSYQLISGERRLRASKLAGLTEIPAYVRTANDQQMLEMALIENIQRENLNAIEVALSFQRMIDECNLKQEQLGERVSKNRSTVTNYLRLLKLPPAIQASIRDKEISMGHARALISVEDVDKQIYLFRR